jgi:hypothetical protein
LSNFRSKENVMLKKLMLTSALTAVLALLSVQALAQKPEPIYGSQLMTEQERSEYRDRMRAAKTIEAREKIREENHRRMSERAKQQGISLPDQPRPGLGKGPGSTGGAGPGAGGPGR